MKIAFLVNKMIKRYHRIKREIERNFAADYDYKIFTSDYGGHIKLLANEAHRLGYNYLITVGGDGSINECLNGILSRFKRGNEFGPESFDWKSIQEVKLGLLPSGTGNDFARYHGLKHDIKHLKKLIENDTTKALDIGWTQYIDKKDQPAERFFINITDVGMGGHTVEHMEEKRIRWLSPRLNYMKAIVSSFISYEKSKVKWQSAHQSWEGNIMSMVIANGKFFGSGLGIAPNAKMDDGLFSIVTLGDITIWDYLKNINNAKESKMMDHPEVTYGEVDKIYIESIDGQKLPIDMDGDFVGFCPMTLQCIPNAVTFLV